MIVGESSSLGSKSLIMGRSEKRRVTRVSAGTRLEGNTLKQNGTIMRIHRMLSVGAWTVLLAVGTFAGRLQAQPVSVNTGVSWPATDALGRTLPLPDEVGKPRPGRFVGIFYFLWLNERANKSPHWEGPYDVARILAKDPDALKKPDSPLWGPIGRSHYWE